MSDFANLKIAVAGAGLMGRWHVHCAQRLGAQVVAVLDTDHARGARLAQQSAGRVSVVDDLNGLLDRQVDVLHVCTPLGSHYPIVAEALRAGLHVIVEKPLAETAQQTEALLALAQQHQRLLCPVHQFGFQAGVERAIAALPRIGELLHLRFTTGSAGAEGAMRPDEVIADIIPHPLSVLQKLQPQFTFDEQGWHGLHAAEGELQLIARAGKLTLDFYISMNSRPTRCEMELFGSSGRIKINFFHGYSLIETGRPTRAQKLIQPFRASASEFIHAGINLLQRCLHRESAYPGLRNLVRACYLSINGQAEPPVSPEEMLDIARIRDRVIQDYLPDAVPPGAGQ